VEKPLCDDAIRARSFAGRTDLFVMDKWRYHRGVQTLRHLVLDRQFGELLGMRTKRLSTHNPHIDVDAIWTLTPHDLAIIHEVTGRVPQAVAATGESDGIEASLTALFEGDVVIEVSSRWPSFTRLVGARFESATVFLTDGYSDTLEVLIHSPGAEPARQSIHFTPNMPLADELRHFVDHLSGGPPPMSSADDGIKTVELIQELRDMAGIRER
jgi:predicted dehydrogenase